MPRGSVTTRWKCVDITTATCTRTLVDAGAERRTLALGMSTKLP